MAETEILKCTKSLSTFKASELKSNLHYARCITPKRVTSRQALFLRHCACGQHSSF